MESEDNIEEVKDEIQPENNVETDEPDVEVVDSKTKEDTNNNETQSAIDTSQLKGDSDQCDENIKSDESQADSKEDVAMDLTEETPEAVDNDVSEDKTPVRRGRRKRGQIYDEGDDPDTIKEKRKKRSVELKLRNLKCSFNETPAVSGKRLKKPPQRFELQPTEKRKCSVDDGKGRGELLGNIRWISHQLRGASLYNLRMLHRLIYRKQGMFAEKHIIKSVMKFNGFPFDASHPELKRRREQLERLPNNSLQMVSYILGLRPGSNTEMVHRIISFLLCPTQKQIESYISEVMDNSMHQAKATLMDNSMHQAKPPPPPPQPKPVENSFQKAEPPVVITNTCQEENNQPYFPEFTTPVSKIDLISPWKKPEFFLEGHGVKLKFIRAIIANIEAASDAFVELMHRLLYLNVDEKSKMRRNILEFSGLRCDVGTPNYVYRLRILSVLPMEQLKLICRVLCLPTWHKSRQILTDAIMDFLSVPRVSAMKKRVPPVFSEEISFSFDNAKVKKPELKSVESEEIEIIPDIHIPDDRGDFHMENEYLGVKLKNFSNIHYQVISTPAAKLNDVHRILYLTTSAVSNGIQYQNNIRKNILEFSGFPFDEISSEYLNRRSIMERMSVEDLKTVATVLCVSQYICDDSKKSLIDAILKFLLKPSALLSSSTIMPTISQTPVAQITPSVVKKNATSTTVNAQPVHPIIKRDTAVSNVGTSSDSKDTSVKAIIDAISSSGKNEAKKEIEKVKKCLSKSSIQITPVPQLKAEFDVLPCKYVEPHVSSPPPNQSNMKKESKDVKSSEPDEPLLTVKKEVETVAPRVQYFGSDDEDDQPLAKMIGHPNDDQLRALVLKIIKESKLEEITMKHVIRKVFETYPNYDLNYRKEFIKSNVRLVLSQMGDQNCSVSTTVITI